MTLAKAKAKTNETFIVQASLKIISYDHQNIFIVQATGWSVYAVFCLVCYFKERSNAFQVNSAFLLEFCSKAIQFILDFWQNRAGVFIPEILFQPSKLLKVRSDAFQVDNAILLLVNSNNFKSKCMYNDHN
jgi:hypothetical protein